MPVAGVRSLLAVAVLVAGGALVVVVVLALSLNAGAPASSARALHPVVVQTAEATLEGPGGHGVTGPQAFRARFSHPTRPGDLLVLAVIDGVATSGMEQPAWSPPGWWPGVDQIGGQTATTGAGPPDSGGLQAAIFYWPDNPGAITSVTIGYVPSGTKSANTAVLAELSGVPSTLQVVASGTSTNGPFPRTYTDRSSVTASAPPSRLPALVLAAFTNGGTTRHGEKFEHSAGWRVLGQDANRGGIDQPILFDERVWREPTAPEESMSYSEYIDNCAALVALG